MESRRWRVLCVLACMILALPASGSRAGASGATDGQWHIEQPPGVGVQSVATAVAAA